MRAKKALARAVTALAVTLGLAACGAQDFDPVTLVQSVRVLSTRADKPYARPGDKVEIEMLAYDGRKDTSRPMHIYWLPFACVNPKLDAYYACFQALSPGGSPAGDAGAPSGAAGALRPGVDLTPFLTEGPKYSLTLPRDIITSHPPVPGAPSPYGLSIVFNMACAGHVEIVERDPSNPQSLPVGCFDQDHNRLGPDDYVFGFTRVYAYDTQTNQNPRINVVTYDGKPVDLQAGITVDHCTAADKKDCPKTPIGVDVLPDNQEVNPADPDEQGNPRKEQLWVAYFSTGGRFDDSARLLYDPRQGRISDSDTKFQPPQEVGDGFIWVVVHDNRNGVAWAQVPLHSR